MSSKIDQLKIRLDLASPIGTPEIKILLKDIYKQIESLQNEIRKISENRPRTDKVSGKSVQAS